MEPPTTNVRKSTVVTALTLVVGVWCMLALVDRYVLGAFVPTVVTPRFEPAHLRLADRTSNHNLSILFAATEERIAAHQHVVAVVGDSTVMAFGERDDFSLTEQISRAVARQPNLDTKVTVAEFAALGLPTDEALVLVSKALGIGVDLVVYAITPRVICDLPQRLNDVANHLMDSDVAKLLGPRFLLQNYSPAALASGAVQAHWALLRFRHEINSALTQWTSSFLGFNLPLSTPANYVVPAMPRLPMSVFFWTHKNCRLDASNQRVQAFIRLADTCAASGRCLFYFGPINQSAMARFEPGLVGEFSLWARGILRERRVPFRNYSYLVPENGFLRGPLGQWDAIHLNVFGRQRLANLLGPEIAHALEQRQSPI